MQNLKDFIEFNDDGHLVLIFWDVPATDDKEAKMEVVENGRYKQE
jgi:hypothetical protein